MTDYGPLWQEQRQKALERDNFECQFCGREDGENDVGLHVHHQIPYRAFDDDEKAHDLDNLITVCSRCHGRIESGKLPDSEPDIRDDVSMY